MIPQCIFIFHQSLNKDDAPAGKENWFVMVNAPHIQDQNWDIEVKSARKNVVKKINNFLNTDIESLIEFEKIMSPS